MDMTYVVHERDRAMVFEGRLLGEASSFRPGKPRWTETRIFRTEAGSYIVATIGKTEMVGEVDRCRAQVCDSPEGAVETLYTLDENSVRYMTATSRRAAEAAALIDEEFAGAFRVEHVA